ncbi:hypothetical protein [Kineosporia babensis]|uniref:Uncharacterized protein n=1 Tax=Kineosporia babensis TaxID=499548 RepID=A0A9X1NPV5_9ACTN|nr:hypothetical protein [Kineosporia babensis]MCD5316983.1 hypothetical protein [Kineosporia babensis]
MENQVSGAETRLGIHIPAGPHQPITLMDLAEVRKDGSDFSGSLDLWVLDRPDALLIARNPEARKHLAQNRRATVLAWNHHPGMHRERGVLHGPVLVTGALNGDGMITTAPAELVNLLMPAGRLQMQIKSTEAEGPWRSLGQDDDWFGAYQWMLTYTARSPEQQSRLLRVVPAMSTRQLEHLAQIEDQGLLDPPGSEDTRNPIKILSCTGIDDLAEQIRTGPIPAGSGFHWRDLCLVSLSDDGQHWVAIRNDHALTVTPPLPHIEDGTFAAYVMKLTHQQAADDQN